MASPSKVNFSRLSYVVYEHPDLDRFLEFSKDFGFENAGTSNDGNIYLCGYGIDPYLYIARKSAPGKNRAFRAAGFVARTSGDFDRACKMQGAKEVDISMRPGGGRMVRIPDLNGFDVEVVFGQKEKTPSSRGVSNVTKGQPNVNVAMDKPRKGVSNRMAPGPAMIHKLGHFGYATDKHAATCAWYTSNFNFKASDILHKPGDESFEILAFFHLDLGQEYSDHHCLLIAIQEKPGNNTPDGEKLGTTIHHSSFEVEDLDTQMMGHRWLADKDYKKMWGVGRHVMGSQVFDYWFDTTGFVLEHYADSDVVNEDTPTCRQSGTPGAIWGPPLPTSSKWE